MIKLLYAIAKAIPALQKILDKLFREGRVLSASRRLDAKDAAVDSAVDRLHKRKTEQQRKIVRSSGVQKSSVSVTGVRKRSTKDNKSSRV